MGVEIIRGEYSKLRNGELYILQNDRTHEKYLVQIIDRSRIPIKFWILYDFKRNKKVDRDIGYGFAILKNDKLIEVSDISKVMNYLL